MLKHKKTITAIFVTACCVLSVYGTAQALPNASIIKSTMTTVAQTKYACGSGSSDMVYTAIDFGCYGDQCAKGSTAGYCSKTHSAIIDLVYAVIRFLSDGVGLVIIASLIIAGIQYITSSGNPESAHKAMDRIRSSVIALLLFIFAYALLNYLIPVGFFNQ